MKNSCKDCNNKIYDLIHWVQGDFNYCPFCGNKLDKKQIKLNHENKMSWAKIKPDPGDPFNS